MSGPFSPSETRYEDNKATWLPEVGFASAANNREKDEACALYEVVYEEADRATLGMQDPKYYTAFVWHMAGDLLLYVRKARLSRANDPSRALFSCLS